MTNPRVPGPTLDMDTPNKSPYSFYTPTLCVYNAGHVSNRNPNPRLVEHRCVCDLLHHLLPPSIFFRNDRHCVSGTSTISSSSDRRPSTLISASSPPQPQKPHHQSRSGPPSTCRSHSHHLGSSAHQIHRHLLRRYCTVECRSLQSSDLHLRATLRLLMTGHHRLEPPLLASGPT
ncbi:leucine-rich repeat extensin-like protein 3 [Iris pallida]|uniref:Leucine-rich repeat extensin-like protein 3 n=1 Tax=Iris pallida TaxID=29817 RepID=A0AAX6G8L5_IRIPA|nr:leucine-rich repeat extensin-like protein 3 [Iris pallida]